MMMSTAGAFSDFHIEFSGTTPWQHIKCGYQFYFLIRPTSNNIELLERYYETEDDNRSFFAEYVKNCEVVRVNATQTLMIPAGTICEFFERFILMVFGEEKFKVFTERIENSLLNIIFESCEIVKGHFFIFRTRMKILKLLIRL